MAEVSSVVLNYAVRGADRAQRKDKQVRESVKRTGREARKQSGTINRWMQRHQTAIAGIAAATAGAMMAVIKHSPTLRGELAGLRLAFSLFAMTVGEDVAPALDGLSEKALDVQQAYADLPGAVREPISALIGFGLAATFVVTAIAGLETVIGGTIVASALGTIATLAKAAGAALLGFISTTAAVVAAIVGIVLAAGLLASEFLGITDVISEVNESQNGFVRAASNLVFFLLGPFIASLAVAFAFWEGGWSNAKRVALRFIDEMGKALLRFLAGIGAFLSSMSSIIHTVFEVAWDFAVNATKAAWNQISRAVVDGANMAIRGLNRFAARTETTVNKAINALNKLPDTNIGNVSIGRISTISGSGGFDVESPGSIMGRAEDRLANRFGRTRSNLRSFREQFAAEEIRMSPGGGAKVEDNSTTVENLNIPIQSTGDSQIDAENAGRAAMNYIEEQRSQRN